MSAEACLRWLRRDTPDITAASRAAERAVRDGMRASQIVQRTREQLRRDRRDLEAIDLRHLLAEVATLLDREILAASATVRTIVPEDAARVLADRVEMQQVVVNLVTNGLHAMRAVPETRRELRIEISTPEPDRIRLAVSDSGTASSRGNCPSCSARSLRRSATGWGSALRSARLSSKPMAGR